MDSIALSRATDSANPSLYIQTHLPPSPTSVPVPPKRLRSCLSPTRRRPSPDPFGVTLSVTSSISTDEPSLTCSSSPMTSRSASFSSQDESGDWRRGRNVRWDESGGCIMAAYYSTWSADDYDRSPLEPPKPEERACFMPARGSRCLSPLDCFADVNPDDAFFPKQEFQSFTTDPISSSLTSSTTTLTGLADVSDDLVLTEADAEAETETETEDKEWEECMERRRMMFAQMCRPSAASDEAESSSASGAREEQRRFEGYTSISASLVALLSQSGIGHRAEQRDAATPVGTPVEIEEAFGAFGIGTRPKLVRVEHRLRVSSFAPEEDVVEEVSEEDQVDEEDEEEEHEDEEHGEQPSAETVFAALRAMRGPGRELRSGAEERDRASI